MVQVSSNETLDQTRSKLVQVFRYVQAFNHLQNPVQQNIEAQSWVMWFHDLPRHPYIRMGIKQEGSSTLASQTGIKTRDIESDDNFVLKVRRPKLTEAPEPPKEIASFLQNGWQYVDNKVALDPAKSASFASDPRKQRLLEEWSLRREAWIKAERPNVRVLDIYNRLYALSAQLAREAEHIELVLGNGILSWYPTPSNGVHHPVLLLRLQLHFNPQIPEFTIAETEHPAELYTALFQILPEINAINIGRSRQDFEQGGYHPLGGNETSQFLQRLVNQLSSQGQFVENAIEQRNKSIPLITRDPVLFLRDRTLGFSTAIDAILESLPTSSYLPQSITSLITSDTHGYQQTSDLVSPIHSPNGEDEHVLLSKPANAEQLEIARRLEKHGAVVVQGPPGTGKTHTIANLIGHFLAQGKSVLVTSHTSKALKVLREKVVKPLQPLCVSILEDDSRKQMESAIDAITERLSYVNKEQLERDAVLLTKQRLNVIHEIQRNREQLKDARNSEYEVIVIAGQSYTPSEAARYVAHHCKELGWVPAPVAIGIPLPLSQEELIHLYRTNLTVPLEDEREIASGLPNAHTLLSPVVFTQLVTEHDRLRQENLAYRRDLWTQNASNTSPEKFVELQTRLSKATESLRDTTRWRLEALMVGREGGLRRQAWDELIIKIERVQALAHQNYASQLEYNPVILHRYEQNQLERLLKIAEELVNHLTHAGKLNGITLFMHKEWKTFLERTQVKGRSPETLEHFQALQRLLQLLLAREDLAGRWQRQMTVLGGPDTHALGAEPERLCSQFVYPLRQCLDWYNTTWEPLERELMDHGLLWTKFLAEMPVNMTEHGDLLRVLDAVQVQLSPVLRAETHRRMYEVNDTKLAKLHSILQAVTGDVARTEVVQALRHSVTSYNVQGYSKAYTRLVDLQERHEELQSRFTLLDKLEKSAPVWAATIRRREGIHGKADLPENPEAAWIWRQLSDELNRRSSVSLETLQDRITQLSNTLHAVTAELVEKKAWICQVQRTTGEQRRALQGWKEITRKIGKGTGKRAAQLRTEAQKLMPLCQTAVPVWIMPLNRVVQNFDPRHNHFDVVIIDEASQADIKALTALYMGQQVVVVGDHEQVTPLAVGQRIDDIEHLIDEHLQGIPLAKMFDGKLSIYTLAQTAYGVPVCLQEHFRCVSPIIQFSNNLSYQGKIKPLRDDSEVQRTPPTVAYRVKASQVRSSCNKEETQTIASLLVAMTEQPEYRDASFGIISMAKEEQALNIDTLLRKYLTETEYARREILCGTPAQFQGDERDVIFLSMVDTPEGNGPLALRSEDGNDYMYKKRFNVAASRARDQMWVVHSLDPHTNLKDGDIRKRLILHAENPKAFAIELAEQENRVESEFEKQVLRRLMQAGYRVVPQWRVGAYRIDLVVEGGGKRLAVECDGDRWHPIEKLAEDMARQAILERLGWRFERIRGSQFFRNPDKAMEPVFARLHTLEIPPEGNKTITSLTVQDTSLKEKVIRRAVEIRQGWHIQI
ncbi:MAG: AAA domain-containing protein [Ktedonobacteraceae bacterium]